MEITKLLN